MGRCGEYKTSYTINVETVNKDTKYKNTKLIIYVKNGIKLEYGVKIGFSGIYQIPSKASNYKAFDYKDYLKTKNIYGSVNIEDDIKILSGTDLNPTFIISNNLKNKIGQNLDEILGEEAKIANGILLRGYL